MNYNCDTCNLRFETSFNLKRHVNTEKHADAVNNKAIYVEYFKKAQYLRVKETNIKDMNIFKETITLHNITLNKYNLPPLDPLLSDNLKNRILATPLSINVKKYSCMLCNQIVTNSSITKTDAYLKKIAEHYKACHKRNTHEETVPTDIVDNHTLLEYCKTLQANLLKMIDLYKTEFDAHKNETDVLAKEKNILLAKNIKLKTKRDNLEEECKKLREEVSMSNKNARITPTQKPQVQNIQIINAPTSYNYAVKNYPDAPSIAQMTKDFLQDWYEISELPLAIKNGPEADYIKCLGNNECKGKCSLGDNCMGTYSLEDELLRKFDATKCSKKKKIEGDKTVTYHNKCPASAEYSKFLGSIIIHCYKRDRPEEQSLWNVDSTRYSYIIKMIKDNISQWQRDTSGTKTKKHVVEPLIANISKLLLNYKALMWKSYLTITKIYVGSTIRERKMQIDKFNSCNKKNKIKAKPITDPDVERTYNLDYFDKDLNEIYNMTHEDTIDQDLIDLVASCNEFNNNNGQEYKINDYNVKAQRHIDKRVKIQKIIDHINDKEFSTAVVRDIAPQFYLDRNVNNKPITNGNKIIIEEMD